MVLGLCMSWGLVFGASTFDFDAFVVDIGVLVIVRHACFVGFVGGWFCGMDFVDGCVMVVSYAVLCMVGVQWSEKGGYWLVMSRNAYVCTCRF